MTSAIVRFDSTTTHPATLCISNIYGTPPSESTKQYNIDNKQHNIELSHEGSIHYKASDLSSTDMYKLIIGSVVPRPIAWLSTVNTEGQTNLAPYSFFQGVCHDPPTLIVSIVRQSNNKKKDSLINIEQTKQFVINTVSEHSAIQMNESSATLDYGDSEISKYNLTPVKCSYINGYRIAESYISFECELQRIVHVGSDNSGSDVVFGTIIGVHIRKEVYIDNHKIDISQYKPISRLAGNAYGRVNEIFELIRPK